MCFNSTFISLISMVLVVCAECWVHHSDPPHAVLLAVLMYYRRPDPECAWRNKEAFSPLLAYCSTNGYWALTHCSVNSFTASKHSCHISELIIINDILYCKAVTTGSKRLDPEHTHTHPLPGYQVVTDGLIQAHSLETHSTGK